MKLAKGRIGAAVAFSISVSGFLSGFLACQARGQAPPTEETKAQLSATTAAAAAPVQKRPPAAGRECEGWIQCTWWQDPDPKAQCCDGQCAYVSDDPENCGGCGVSCAPGQICHLGKCQGSRPRPKGGPATATAVDTLRLDCTTVKCAAGQICCGGACIDPVHDLHHCGSCSVTCRFEGGGCAFGVCCSAAAPDAACRTATCPVGQVVCGAGCLDISADSDNCGACGNVCPASARSCISGTCQS